MDALLVFDSSFLIRFKDELWNRRTFYPVQRAMGEILEGGYGYVIHEVLGEIKAPEFVKWVKSVTKEDNFDVMMNEGIQSILNGEVVPAYKRHQVGSIEKQIVKGEYAADPILISHALYLERTRLFPVIVVAQDAGIEKICGHLQLRYADWDEFFDSFMYDFMRSRCPGCYPGQGV